MFQQRASRPIHPDRTDPPPAARYSRAVRMSLALLLFIPGLVLVGTPAFPIGLALCWAGWWIYERSKLPDRDGLLTVLMVLGGLGAASIVVQAGWQALQRL